MGELEDVLYRMGKVITAPREAFDTHIAERYSSALPLAIYIALSFSLGSLTVKGIVRLLDGIPLYNLGWLLELGANLSGVLGVAAGLIDLLIYSSLVHITARVMGYREGRWDDLVGLIAYSSVPLVFPTALAAVAYAGSWIPLLLGALILVIPFSLWSLYLVVVSASVNYGMSVGYALIATVVGPVAVALVALALASKLGALGLLAVIVGLIALYLWRR